MRGPAALLALLLALPATLGAQTALPRLVARPLAPGFYVIDEDAAHGGAIGILTGPEGTVLIDGGNEVLAPQAVRVVAALGGGRPRFLLNTHAHVDETGGNALFAAQGATIIARSAVRRTMAAMPKAGGGAASREGRQIRQVQPAALPVITYEGTLGLHLNGQTIEAISLPPAHTDGDALVLLRDLNIVMAGDMLRAGEFPSINHASGGTVAGMMQALDRLIELTDEHSRIVTSRGVIATRADAVAQRAMLAQTQKRILALMAQGQGAEQIVAARIMQDSGIADRPGRITADVFVADMCRDLMQHPAS